MEFLSHKPTNSLCLGHVDFSCLTLYNGDTPFRLYKVYAELSKQVLNQFPGAAITNYHKWGALK
jgi:hypothetical protein